MINERRVVLYIATSLDGYIARDNGAIDWLEGDNSEPESDLGYEKFYEGIDTVILGRTTYEQVINELSPDEWPYKDKEGFVVTTKNINNQKNITFVKEDIGYFVKELKQKQGKDIWIIGGAELVDGLIKENLIDDYMITIMPIILGEGIPLFKEKNPEIRLTLKESQSYNGAVMMHYRRG